ncbi:uncharacterized protein [Dendropsophus ebraccatus]|uniref:uncharacterized protein isoform X2 n=1 Tax=Dendropsophus ebraccatus TaxID=150705 RepID=UPI0038322B72
MELSPDDTTLSPPMPNNNINIMDTPCTSNLKFLRAKRLSYFCGTKSQNSEQIQNKGQTPRTATPRRCLSAPTSKHITGDSDRPKRINAERKITPLNRASSSPQYIQANQGKENLTDIPSHHIQHLPTTEGETKEETETEPSWGPNRSIPKSLQPKISNPPVLSVHHTLPPGKKDITEDILIQHGPQDPVSQSCHKENKGKESSMDHDLLSMVQQVKDKTYLPLSRMKPESDEVDVLSTHRSLLRSSFVSDLDQDLLEDLSVPETEKLHHVMTWAKKFLDKCNGGELVSSTGDTSLRNKKKDTSFESIGSLGVTNKYLERNNVSFDEYDSKKHHCLGEESQEPVAGQSQLYKPKLKHKTTSLDSFSAEPTSSLVKNRDVKDIYHIKDYADSGEQYFANIKQDYIDSDNIFGYRPRPDQQHYNRSICEDTKSDVSIKDEYINREVDSSSPESCLNTERLNSLLGDLELIEKGFGENNGARTDRTFLVKNSAKSDFPDSTYVSVSGKFSNKGTPALHRVDSTKSLSGDDTRKIYQECPACSFFNASSCNWCAECGSALKGAKGQPIGNKENLELLNPQILDDNAVEEFFSANNQRKSYDNNHMSKQNAKELGRTVCWEDSSDVASESEGSVLDKYFFYVKQLDMLRSQEIEKQTKPSQYKYASETSSGEESSEDYSMSCVSGQAKLWGETKTPETYLDHQAMEEKNVKESSDHIIGTEGSSLKGLLDRKLQKATNVSPQLTGPKRYWEKSSIAWSSYTHGELKPRSKHNIQRPSSADLRNNKDELQDGKPTEINAANETKRLISGENDCNKNFKEYKNEAVAYMKTCNAWAVSEQLCKDKWERSQQNQQRMWKEENGSIWLLLPDELWIYIFNLLSHGDLSKVAQVCQRFRYIANDDSLWKVIKVTNCHSLKDSCLLSIGRHHPESLSLYRCHDDTQNITDVGFRQLFQHCKDSLKRLNITNCSGEIFKGDTVLLYASNHCPRLTSVDISWTGATDNGIITLVQACACLQSLSMNGCNITDNAVTALLKKHSKSLIKLEIFGCHALTAKCLISVATECVHLENLNIGKIPKANDVFLAKIGSNLHKITTLNLTGLSVVRDRAVHHIVKQCSKLENLTLSCCLQVTDVSLVEISTYRTTIKYLDLSGCKKVSDIGIQAIARSCQQLQYLDLSSTGTGKRGLKVLHLYGCRLSSDLGDIKKLGRPLQILHDLSIPTANILGE